MMCFYYSIFRKSQINLSFHSTYIIFELLKENSNKKSWILSCSNIKTNKKEQQTIVDSTDISVNDIIKDVSSEKIIEKKEGNILFLHKLLIP